MATQPARDKAIALLASLLSDRDAGTARPEPAADAAALVDALVEAVQESVVVSTRAARRMPVPAERPTMLDVVGTTGGKATIETRR